MGKCIVVFFLSSQDYPYLVLSIYYFHSWYKIVRGVISVVQVRVYSIYVGQNPLWLIFRLILASWLISYHNQ